MAVPSLQKDSMYQCWGTEVSTAFMHLPGTHVQPAGCQLGGIRSDLAPCTPAEGAQRAAFSLQIAQWMPTQTSIAS